MVLIQLLLPIDADRDRLSATQRELTERFSGITAYVRSPARGAWTAPDGNVEQDDVVMVEVVTDSFDRAWWQSYSGTLRTRFRQERMHIRAIPIEMVDEDAC